MRSAHPSPSGIYAIISAVNSRTYVGSSVDIQNRWGRHRTQLRKGTHHSPHLQRAWDKYGEAAFEFVILEECPVELLIEREQYYFDQHPNKYNCDPVAGSRLGSTHSPETREKVGAAQRGRKASPETRAKLSAMRMGHPVSDETREKLRKASIGNTSSVGAKRSPETRARMSASQRARRERERSARQD